MRAGFLAAALIGLAVRAANADCASEARAALEARLTSLPLREVVDSDRDGEHTRVVLEFETLQRFHLIISGAPGSSAPAVELLILDGGGWSREEGHWKPFAAAAATATSTADDERALADQLTDGAAVTCLGLVDKGGRGLNGYELQQDADPSGSAPYTTMRLYVEPKSGMPQSLEMSGQGEAGPSVTRQTFEYIKTLKLVSPQ